MSVESALIKPITDALMKLLSLGNDTRLNRQAEKKIQEAIRDLLQANPDVNKAEAALLVAKAAKLLSPEVLLAEQMLKKVKKTHKKSVKKRARKKTTATKKKAARK